MGRSGRGRENEVGAGRDEVARGAAGEEVAYARARFAVDPSTPTRLADAWSAPTGLVEEDESEFVDAVADCLSVGLPLDAAVASWRTGSLQVPAGQDQGQGQGDDDDDTTVFEEDETRVYVPASNRGASPR